VTDPEGDILAGRHLDSGVQITAGMRMTIDVFTVWVVECVQGSSSLEVEVEVVDLTPEPEHVKPEPRFGGRFWVLADGDDDDMEDQPLTEVKKELLLGFRPEEPLPVLSSPTQDASGEKRRERTVFGPRTTASSVQKIKPWIGPIPKVIFRATTLIRMWSLLTPTDARERMVTGSIRWETVARAIFNRFEWRSCNRIGV